MASHAQAAGIIVEGRGRHFDPDMVDAFPYVAAGVLRIAERYADSDEDMARRRNNWIDWGVK